MCAHVYICIHRTLIGMYANKIPQKSNPEFAGCLSYAN